MTHTQHSTLNTQHPFSSNLEIKSFDYRPTTYYLHTNMRGLSLLVASQLSTLGLAFPFIVPFSSTTNRLSSTRGAPTRLFADDNSVWEQELEETKLVMTRLEALEATIKDSDSTDDKLEELKEAMDVLEQDIMSSKKTPLCPKGLSMEDFKAGIRAYSKLPLSLQLGLYTALDMKTDTKYPTVAQYPEIVARLYEQRQQLTAQKLEDAQKAAALKFTARSNNEYIALDGTNPEAETQAILAELLEGKTVDEVQSDNVVKQQLGRVTRKEGVCATAVELEVLMNVLKEKEMFIVRGTPEEIPGGYVVRGTNRKNTSKELIDALDEKLPLDWKGSVSYMRDITSSGLDQEDASGDNEPVLILLNNDFSPETNWIQPLSTSVAVVSTFLYGISVYASNENVAAQLAESSALGDVSAVDWFNGRLLDVLLPLLLIQVLHELGHFLVAQKDKVRMNEGSVVNVVEQSGGVHCLALRKTHTDHLLHHTSSTLVYRHLFHFTASFPTWAFVPI
jgi:hypothetical protein